LLMVREKDTKKKNPPPLRRGDLPSLPMKAFRVEGGS